MAHDLNAHVDAETLAAWADGSLPPAAMLSVDAHLADCDRCRAMAAAFARASVEASAPASASAAAPVVPIGKINRPPSPMRWFLPLAATVTLVSVVSWALWNRLARPDSPDASSPADSTLAGGAPMSSSQMAAPQAPPESAAAPPAAPPVQESGRRVPNASARKSDGRAQPPSPLRAGGSGGQAISPRAPEIRTAPQPPPIPTLAPLAAPAPPPATVTAPARQAAPPPPPAAVIEPPLPAAIAPPPPAAIAPPPQPAAATQSLRFTPPADQASRDPWVLAPLVVVSRSASTAAPLLPPLVVTGGVNAGGSGGAPTRPASPTRGGEGRGAVEAAGSNPPAPARWRVLTPTTIERSIDGGATWTRVSFTGSASAAVSGSSPTSDVCWLVGHAGFVMLSVDGRTFNRLIFPEPVDLTSVLAEDARHATVITADGRTFITDDGGVTWRVAK